jgi:hypothetical protein
LDSIEPVSLLRCIRTELSSDVEITVETPFIQELNADNKHWVTLTNYNPHFKDKKNVKVHGFCMKALTKQNTIQKK